MFRAFEDSVYSRYAGAITWRDRLAGGTPSDPKLIEGWLKSKMPGMTNDIERRHMLLRTLREMGAEIPETDDIMAIDMAQLEEAASKVAASRGANGFKRPNRVVRQDGTVEHPGYLAIETRHLKAGLKEWINILFAGTRWGVTKKAPKSFSAEHIFVNPLLDPDVIGEAVYQELTKPDPDDARRRKPLYPDFLFLTKFDAESAAAGGPLFTMVTAPDDVETFIGHVSGPQGPRSNLTRVEVVSGATIHFESMILRDEIQHTHWPIIFLAGQENGLGAMRSQGYGRFDVTRFERTAGKFQPLNWDEVLAKVDKDKILSEYQQAKEKLVEDGEISGEDTAGLVPMSAASTTKKAKAAPKNGKVAVGAL
jgi:hypothetical protein